MLLDNIAQGENRRFTDKSRAAIGSLTPCDADGVQISFSSKDEPSPAQKSAEAEIEADRLPYSLMPFRAFRSTLTSVIEASTRNFEEILGSEYTSSGVHVEYNSTASLAAACHITDTANYGWTDPKARQPRRLVFECVYGSDPNLNVELTREYEWLVEVVRLSTGLGFMLSEKGGPLTETSAGSGRFAPSRSTFFAKGLSTSSLRGDGTHDVGGQNEETLSRAHPYIEVDLSPAGLRTWSVKLLVGNNYYLDHQ